MNKIGSMFLLIVMLQGLGCAAQRLAENSAPASSDARADASLGMFQKKETSETEKQAEALESEDEATRALKELRKKEAQEEIQRLQRSVTDFGKTEQELR